MTAARPPLLAESEALYLDFDGTLADIALRPDHVIVHEPLPALLAALLRHLGGAVAVVTGRSLADIDAMLAPLSLPGAGVHGAELRLANGEARVLEQPPEVAAIARELRGSFADDPRIFVEDKGAAVALHYRQAPERAEECVASVARLAAAAGLQVLQGRMVVEMRRPGVDKGAALCMLALHAPFATRRPVFVGDDTTDEDGFRAAAALGGHGVKVGPGRTAAPYRIDEVSAVHAWLESSLRSLDAGGAG